MFRWLLASGLTVIAAVTGAVLLEPHVARFGLPPAVLERLPFVLFGALVLIPIVLSGSWLWGERRRKEEARHLIGPRIAVFTSAAALVLPLVLTDKPVVEVAKASTRQVLVLSGAASPAVEAPTPSGAEPRPSGVEPPPPVPTPAPIARRWSTPTPVPMVPERPLEPTVEPTPPPTEDPPQKLEDPPLVLLPPALGPGEFLVYEWRDATGQTHWADDLNELPPNSRVVKISKLKADTTHTGSTPPPPLPTERPSSRDPWNDPMIPSMQEQYWRNRFGPAIKRTQQVEARVKAKRREIDEASILANRRVMEQQLRAIEEELQAAQGELQDLEREASYRAVPREWRH